MALGSSISAVDSSRDLVALCTPLVPTRFDAQLRRAGWRVVRIEELEEFWWGKYPQCGGKDDSSDLTTEQKVAKSVGHILTSDMVLDKPAGNRTDAEEMMLGERHITVEKRIKNAVASAVRLEADMKANNTGAGSKTVRWGRMMSKLRLWELTEYSQIVYLDADAFAMQVGRA